MIEYTDGSIFESGCEALVNPVNCVGVMGAGLALQFRQRYARMFIEYKRSCTRGLLRPGSVQPVKVSSDNPQWVLNLATKDNWRDPSQMAWVEKGLDDLKRFVLSANIQSVAIPAIGCGYGNLDWLDVKPAIEQRLGDLAIRVVVFPPQKRERGPMVEDKERAQS